MEEKIQYLFDHVEQLEKSDTRDKKVILDLIQSRIEDREHFQREVYELKTKHSNLERRLQAFYLDKSIRINWFSKLRWAFKKVKTT
jgi:hypothetical protein